LRKAKETWIEKPRRTTEKSLPVSERLYKHKQRSLIISHLNWYSQVYSSSTYC